MMNLEDDFIAVMEASDALMAFLPGGVFSAIAVGEISQQFTPSAYDANKELQACAFVKLGVEVPRGPYSASVQTPVQVFLYEKFTSVNIDNAMALVFTLFNYQKVGAGTWRIEYESGSWNQRDDVLDANLCIMRFNAIRMRRPFEGGS